VPVIELTTEIHAPIERIFNLARSVELHMDSTAETGERAVAGVLSGLMALGDEVTWRARHFGIWQHLTSRITMFQRPFHFRDSMVRGAFRRFDHDHFFAQQEEITVMRDVFDFQSPFGILSRAADRLFLTDYMRRFLLTRCTLIKTVAETEQWRRYLNERP
jgi:ligand-binding SRPBCC domain-containing protein